MDDLEIIHEIYMKLIAIVEPLEGVGLSGKKKEKKEKMTIDLENACHHAVKKAISEKLSDMIYGGFEYDREAAWYGDVIAHAMIIAISKYPYGRMVVRKTTTFPVLAHAQKQYTTDAISREISTEVVNLRLSYDPNARVYLEVCGPNTPTAMARAVNRFISSLEKQMG